MVPHLFLFSGNIYAKLIWYVHIENDDEVMLIVCMKASHAWWLRICVCTRTCLSSLLLHGGWYICVCGCMMIIIIMAMIKGLIFTCSMAQFCFSRSFNPPLHTIHSMMKIYILLVSDLLIHLDFWMIYPSCLTSQ